MIARQISILEVGAAINAYSGCGIEYVLLEVNHYFPFWVLLGRNF